jgi:hypothetical protein
MSIGVSLLVIALGAIFTFAIQDSPGWLNLDVLGVVLMSVGGAGMFLRMSGYGPDTNFVMLPRWRRTVAESDGSPVEAPVSRWQRRRTRIVEERVYDPMAEDPTVYRPEPTQEFPADDMPATQQVVREERRLEH